MTTDFAKAISVQRQLAELTEAIQTLGHGRAYLSPDGQGYALALQGEAAQHMESFMRAVGQYLLKLKEKHADKEAAKAEVVQAFEEWLSKQKLGK